MAKRVTLTNQGLSLLASSSEATGQYYWLGYYAMAYVPNLWKNDTVSLPEDAPCGSVNGGSVGSVEIQPTDTDQVTPTMTRLTKYGDMIYNVWQGDLNGTGYVGCSSDGSAGGDLFALTMYNTNIKKHYRYVLDENGNNTLVGWIEDPEYTDGTMLGKHVFKGTDGYVSSTLPIPAPLYYLGDVTGKTSVYSFFNSLPTFEDENGTSGNGASIYPFITVTLKSTGNPTLDVPRVSADYRGYTDSQGNPGTFNYGGTPPFDTPITAPGTYFDSTEIPYPLDPIGLGFDETSWFAADQTFNISGSTATDAFFSEEFWKLHTISNYNRYHAPVDSVGHVLNSDLSNRNIAKTSKLFPISNYKVINSESGFTSNSEVVDVATAIKLSIDVDITPATLNQGFDETCQVNEQGNIEFFEKYNNVNHPNDAVDEYGNNIYNSTHTSFKFNRIGIYAVPLRKSPYVLQDQGFGNVSSGNDVELQFQINPDDEPVLFAVIDWDNTISMSDTGDGINQFRAEVDVNLESPLGVDDTALLRNTTIFYNMYEDDALRWYQNQLISSASTSNAITEIGLEVAHIKNSAGDPKCCPSPDLSGKFAPINHSHDFLRNLKDANNSLENGLKGIITAPEGSIIDSQSYRLGNASITLGDNTAVLSDRSIIGNGLDNYILDDSDESAILGGYQNYIKSNSDRSTILGGQTNIVNTYAPLSFIGVTSDNTIQYSNNSGIIIGSNNDISGSNPDNQVSRSLIGSGSYHGMGGEMQDSTISSGIYNALTRSSFTFIGAGGGNFGLQSNYIFIGSGKDNMITNSTNAFIGAGNDNSIADEIGAFIGTGILNTSTSSDYSLIGAGAENILESSNYSSIISGSHNYIGVLAQSNFIGAGNNNSIFANDGSVDNLPYAAGYSGIISGTSNRIASNNSFIGAGTSNDIARGSSYSSISAGNSNYIGTNGSYSFIGTGINNWVTGAYSSIVGGVYNYIGENASESFIGGGVSNYIGSNIAGDLTGTVNSATILGGVNNKIGDGANYASIIGGIDTFATIKGEIAHSNGSIYDPAVPSTIEAYNKHSVVMLRGRATNLSQTTVLSLENSTGTNISMNRGDGFAGTLTVVGYLKNALAGACTADGGRSMDTVYHEIHSVSGVYTKEESTGIRETSLTGLTYNEYNRASHPMPSGYSEIETTITGFTMAGAGTTVTVTITGGHLLNSGDIVRVAGANEVMYNGTFIITVTGSDTFTYETTTTVSASPPSGTITLDHVTYEPNVIDHLPSVVDTVLDYRYTNTPDVASYGDPNGSPVQDGFPVITFDVKDAGGVGGELEVTVDSSELYSSNIVESDTVIWWVATLDLTWIQVQ